MGSTNRGIPIIIFAYNRPEYLKRTLNALEKNDGVGLHPIIFYCDGPRKTASSSDLQLIDEVEKIAFSANFGKSLKVNRSVVNKGLANSLTSGISETLIEYEEVIVLEDDIVTSRFFLKYMRDALTLYKKEDRVISIASFNYPIELKERKAETFFLKGADCWGWATWRRGWSLYNNDGESLLNIIVKERRQKEFNLNNSYPYIKMLKKTIAKNHSWAIKWYASAFVNNKLTLYPIQSLVENIGESGTNFYLSNSKILGEIGKVSAVEFIDIDLKENAEIKLLREKHIRKYHSLTSKLFGFIKKIFL